MYEVQLSDEYAKYKGLFLNMPDKLQSVWDRHLEQVSIAKHCFEPTGDNAQPIHSPPYQAGPEPRELLKVDTN